MVVLKRDKLGRILKLDLDEKEIIRLYNERISSPKIANRFNCSSSTIRNILKRKNIKMHPNGSFVNFDKLLKHNRLRKGKTRKDIYGEKKARDWSNKVSKSLTGVKREPLSTNHKQKIKNSMLSHERTEKHCKNISKSKMGEMNGMYGKTGIKSPSWRGGISFEPYDKNFNSKFKKAIKARDGCCMLCNISFEDLKLLKRKVAVHHVNYNKLLSIKENCCSLCNSCHSKTNANRKHWKKFFQSLLSEKYDYKYSEIGEIILEISPIIER